MKHKRSTIIGVVVGALIAASAALAFVLVYTAASGTPAITLGPGSAAGDTQNATALTLGAGVMPINVQGGGSCAQNDFADGCTVQLALTATDNDPGASHTLLTVATPTIAIVGSPQGTCSANWFTFSFGGVFNPAAANVTVTTAGPVTYDSAATLQWVDEPGVNETGCQGAQVQLTFAGTTT